MECREALGNLKPGQPPESRREAARELARWAKASEPEVLRALVAAVCDDDEDLQDAAIESLQKFASEEAVRQVLPLLRHDTPSVRNGARSILERIGSAAPDQIFSLARDPDARMRIFAANVMGLMRDVGVVPWLLQMFQDSDANVQEAAASAVGHYRDPQAIGPLTRLLRDGQPWLRFTVIDAMYRIGGSAAVGALVAALRMSDAEVRLALIDSLSRLAASDAVMPLVDLLGADPELRPEILRVLLGPLKVAVQTWPKPALLQTLAGALVEEILADRLPSDRMVAAVEILEAIGDPKSGVAILRALRVDHPDIQMAAIRAAGTLKLKAALPQLQSLEHGAHAELAAEIQASLAAIESR